MPNCSGSRKFYANIWRYSYDKDSKAAERFDPQPVKEKCCGCADLDPQLYDGAVCREHPDSKISFKLSVYGIAHLLRLLQRKLQINPFFLMVNYGSAVKHSIYDRKISAKLRFCGKKWRWDP